VNSRINATRRILRTVAVLAAFYQKIHLEINDLEKEKNNFAYNMIIIILNH